MARIVVIALTIALLAISGVSATASMVVVPKCQGFEATIVGTVRSEVIMGTPRNDVIVGGGGRDVIHGRGGNDIICGGTGRDIIKGGPGRDTLIGGRGVDKLKGGAGWDVLRGGPDNDQLNGGAGKDACYQGGGTGPVSGCEEADLRVTVTSPPTAEIGEEFTFSVEVRNIGPKPAKGVLLGITFTEHDASCGIDHSGVSVIGTLMPGAHDAGTYFQSCGVLAGSGVVTLAVTATTTSVDEDPSNNTAESSTTIE